jgi:membrane protein YdbS with pleckstrin-like domain
VEIARLLVFSLVWIINMAIIYIIYALALNLWHVSIHGSIILLLMKKVQLLPLDRLKSLKSSNDKMSE